MFDRIKCKYSKILPAKSDEIEFKNLKILAINNPNEIECEYFLILATQFMFTDFKIQK